MVLEAAAEHYNFDKLVRGWFLSSMLQFAETNLRLACNAMVAKKRMAFMEYQTLVIDHYEQLLPYTPAWEDLALNAGDENVFFEPFILIPALRYLNPQQAFVLLVFAGTPTAEAVSLIGLFPLVHQSSRSALGLPYLAIWRSRQCFLGVPIVRRGYEQKCLQALFNWQQQNSKAGFFILFDEIFTQSHFALHLSRFLKHHKCSIDRLRTYQRPLLASKLNTTSYLNKTISGKHRRRLRKQTRGLARLGQVEYQVLDQQSSGQQVLQWAKDFLHLEKKGWKGTNKSALDCNSASRQYFLEITTRAAQQDKLLMLKLMLNDTPIAMQVNFISNVGSFAYKTAYDENYAKYSPGILLALENINHLLGHPQLKWMDSCAQPETPLEQLWSERRTIEIFHASFPNFISRWMVRLLAWGRKVKQLTIRVKQM